jgi:hypothetical protein
MIMERNAMSFTLFAYERSSEQRPATTSNTMKIRYETRSVDKNQRTPFSQNIVAEVLKVTASVNIAKNTDSM